MTARDQWRWADDQGVQRLVQTEELRAALASRVLGPDTLVWREGMSEWLPAAKVPELHGGKSRKARSRPPPRPPTKPRSAPPPPPPQGAPRSHRQTIPGTGLRSSATPMPPIPGPPRVPRDDTSTFVRADDAPKNGAPPRPPSSARPPAPPPAARSRRAIETTRGVGVSGAELRPRNPIAAEPSRPAQPVARPKEAPASRPPPPAPAENTRSLPNFSKPPPAPEPAGAAPVQTTLPSAEASPPTAGPSPAWTQPAPAALSEAPPPNAQPLSLPPPASEEEPHARVPLGRLNGPVVVPVSALYGMSGLLITTLLVAFFVGRCSADPAGSRQVEARAGVGRAIRGTHVSLPPPPKPCWVVRQPVMWALEASKSIPFELSAMPSGNLAMGYAKDDENAVGIEVTPSSGVVTPRFAEKITGRIDRVSPLPSDALDFFVSAIEEGDKPRLLVSVPATPPLVVVLDRTQVGMTGSATDEVTPLWALEGDDVPSAARVLPAGSAGYAITFRRGKSVIGGWLGPDRKPVGDLVTIEGSGGPVGRPNSGWNGREVAVVFADRPPDSRWEMRLGHAAEGSIPGATTVIALPAGGPGGDAFAPDIAGLPDGRWVLLWTEGTAGSRAIRAQTLGPDFAPLGDPIAVSPPAGSFGQGVIGVVGPYAATVFLSRGRSSFELWGAMLRCG